MKEATNALAEYLNTQKNITSCDIYELTLSNGNVYRFADFDTDVTYNGKEYVFIDTAGLRRKSKIKCLQPLFDWHTETPANQYQITGNSGFNEHTDIL